LVASAWQKLVLLVILAWLLQKTYVAGCWQKNVLLVLANFILLALMFCEPSFVSLCGDWKTGPSLPVMKLCVML